MTKEMANRVLVWFAWACLIICVLGWPLTALTVAKDEPPFTLGLSWFAVIQGSVIFLVTAYVKKDNGS